MQNGGDLILTPIRTSVRGKPSEFHVRVENTKDRPYLLFYGHPTPDNVILPHFKVTHPLSLTIGQLHDLEGVPAFILTGGRLMVDIRKADEAWWREHVKKMWPTNDYSDLTHARFEPGGIHLQGRLPSTFFSQSVNGPKLSETARTVVLRLPQPARKRSTEWPAAPADVASSDLPQFRGCAEIAGRRFWTLTGYPFKSNLPAENAPQLPTAADHADGWLQAISAFERPGKRAGSFVDSRRDPPGENCEIAIFEVKEEKLAGDGAAQPVMRWVASNLNTKFTLGGAGSAEAEFAPKRLYGAAAEGWIVAAESIPPDEPPANITNISLTLSRKNDKADPDLTDGLTIGQVNMAPTSIPVGPTATGVRSWMCIDSGWLSIDGRNLSAKVDPALITDGPLEGTLELDVLLEALNSPVAADAEPLTNELGVMTQTLGGSRISIEFTNRPIQPGYRRLTLKLTDPMLTVVTPPVFSSVVNETVLPNLSTTLSSKGSDDDAADEVQKALASYDDKAILHQAVFVSLNVMSTMEAKEALKVGLTYSPVKDGIKAKKEKQFIVGMPATGLSLWEVPSGLPLVRTYPFDSNQSPGTFIDSNRPLLAYHATSSLTLGFRRGRLPTIQGEARLSVDSNTGIVTPSADWRIDLSAGRGGNPSYFLPTLPGLELTSSDNKSLRWVFRHAVPALDESYAEASEERRDPALPRSVPSPGELPPGFDPTRVSGTVAFNFGDKFAFGWLPKSPANAEGKLALVGPKKPRLLGRVPDFSITLANLDGTAKTNALAFSRDSNSNGLSLPLTVTPPPTPGTVEKPEHFTIALGTADAPVTPAFAEEIIREGHALFSILDGGNLLRSQDSTGRIQVQSITGISHSRSLGDDQAAERLNLHIAPTDSIALNLVGVDRTDRPKSGLDLRSWSLHSPSGGPARLLGFPLTNRALRGLSQVIQDGQVMWNVQLETAIGLLMPSNEDIPTSARDPLPSSEPGSAFLTFTKAVKSDAPWQVAKVEGELDWSFRPDDRTSCCILRVVAQINGPASDMKSLQLSVRLLEVYLPTGPVILDFTGTSKRPTATLVNDKFTLDAFTFTSSSGLKLEFGRWVIDRTKLETGRDHLNPLPVAPVLESYKLVWSRPGQNWELQHVENVEGHAKGWSFILYEKDAEFIRIPLDTAVRAAQDRWLLFHAEKQPTVAPGAGVPNPTINPAFPKSSWFDRSRADIGTVGVVFADPDRIATITAEVIVHLTTRETASVTGELMAHVSISFAGPGDTPPPQARLTGWLKLRNQIELVAVADKQEVPVSHFVTLFLDRTPWPFEALVYGTISSEQPFVFSSAVEHQLKFNNESTILWQSVQPIRLLQAAVFEKVYLGPPAKEQADKKKIKGGSDEVGKAELGDGKALALDASWVFWIGEDKEPSTPQGGLSIRSPHLYWGLWLAARRPDRGRLDRQKARLVRVPFGYTSQKAAFKYVLRLVPGGTLIAIEGTGSQAGATAERLATAEQESDGLMFSERGSNARWLSADWLAGLFASADTGETPLLPGYLDSKGKSRTLLPRLHADERKGELDDWGWLIARLPGSELRLPAAALRTPYVPLQMPMRLPGSMLVEAPFLIQVAPPPAPNDKRVDAQLLGFVGGMLTRLRHCNLDPSTLKPGEWAREVVRASRRDEATVLLTNFEQFEFVNRQFDARRQDLSEWLDSAIARPPVATDNPPDDEWDPASRSVTETTMSILDKTAYATVKPRQTMLTAIGAPDWLVYAATPQVAPPTVSKTAAATRFRLAQNGQRLGQVSPALVSVAASAEVERKRRVDGNPGAESGKPFVVVRPVQGGYIMGLTKLEDVAFEVCEKPIGLHVAYPSAGSAPYARRDGAPREWHADKAVPIWTIAPPLLDIVAWARRPGELSRTRWSGQQIHYVEAKDLLQCELAVSPGQAVTLRRPRATPGRFESVNLRVLFSRRLLGGRFQFARLRLTQTITATSPPEPERLFAAISSQSEVFPSFDDMKIATSFPAVLRKKPSPAADPLENFGVFLVADAKFTPTLQSGPSVLARTVVFASPAITELPTGTQNSESPIDTSGVLVLFGNGKSDNDLKDPPKAPWFDVGSGWAFDVLADLSDEQRKKLRDGIKDGTFRSIVVAKYTRAEASKPWQRPGRPLAVISVALIDQGLELVKPKSSVTVLHAPTGAAAEQYSAAGYARLDDDAFTPIRPGKPQDNRADRIEWSRIANLYSLERVPATTLDLPTGSSNSQFDYDVIFYGPGGELVPTKP